MGTPVSTPAGPLLAVFLVGKAGFEPAASASRRPPGRLRAHVLGLIPLVSTVDRVRPDEVERLRVCHLCAMATGALIKRAF